MAIKHQTRGLPQEILAAKGLLYEDWSALTPCQRKCMTRLGMTIQMEQEEYLNKHPEIGAMLKRFIGKMACGNKRKDFLKEAGEHFTQPPDELDADIRNTLNLPPDTPYTKKETMPIYNNTGMMECEDDIRKLISEYYHLDNESMTSPTSSLPFTLSSPFISVVTSDTTLPIPEPVPTPDPTLSETMFAVISNTVDKAIYSRVDDGILRYDTAYVELKKAVEAAMEIPVMEIKKDIVELYYNAYKNFELLILEAEKIAAETAWEKRMRKKLKRLLRRNKNFKGYETPVTPRSEASSHESYQVPPPRPCICHPQFHYNRYPKDRYGIYLPKGADENNGNVTVIPVFSVENLHGENDDKCDVKSNVSKKSAVSGKSAVSKKTN